MSDEVWIALITGVISPTVLFILNHFQNKKLDATKDVVQGMDAKLDENHRQMNGNIDKLVKSTADLATLKEKNKHQ